MSDGQPQELGGAGGLLANPRKVADLNLIGRAITERWPIPPERRTRILTVLQQIVETDEFAIEKIEHEESAPGREAACGKKTVTVKMPNHKNQIAAAKAIMAAAALDQADRHHADGARVHQTSDVRILVADARGNERIGNADDIRRAALGAAFTPSETGGSGGVEGPQPGGDGGAARG